MSHKHPTIAPDVARFEWLVETLTGLAEGGQEIALRDAEKAEPFLAATALLRLALSYAQAVRTLLRKGEADGTPPLQRAIYELWVEQRYLLQVGSARENAIRLETNALLEILEFARARSNYFPPDSIGGAERSLSDLERRFPEVVSAVRAQRGARRLHWSGVSRSQMERAVMPNPDLYKMLSWEAHAVLSPLRDRTIEIDDKSAHFRFEPRDTPIAEPEPIAYLVGGILFFIWNEWAEYFGGPKVEVPSEYQGEGSGSA